LEEITFSGQVVTGTGKAASFTQLQWARDQFITQLGIDPYPGTLNLLLDTPSDQTEWARLKGTDGRRVTSPNNEWCDARCYPIQMEGRLPGAILYPEVPGYPENQVEIISPLHLRLELGLKDGDRFTLTVNRPLPVKAVLFDVDGTLVDSVTAYWKVAERAAAPYGIDIPLSIIKHALNIGHPTFWEMVVPEELPDQAEIIAKAKQEARQMWPEIIDQYGRVFPGTKETLILLKEQGFRLAIMTGSSGGSLRPLKEAELLGFFDVTITARDVSQRKPHPAGLLKCAEALGISPEEAVYVGDSQIDIQASQAAGMASIAVLSGAGESANLSAHNPDWIIHSLAQLPEIVHLDGLREEI